MMKWSNSSVNTQFYYDEITGYIAGQVDVGYHQTATAIYNGTLLGRYINIDKAKEAVEAAHYCEVNDYKS